jgi:hypothetical protein
MNGMPRGDEIFKTVKGGDDAKKQSQATAIVRLVMDADAELFHTPGGEAYISIHANGHQEHHLVGGRASRDYLSRLYYLDAGKAPNASALQDAIGTLSGLARYDGEEHDVYVRVAGVQDRIYLDLGDPDWRAIEITRNGWQIVMHPSVRFRRPRGLLALPTPEPGGTMNDLRPFLNLASDEDFVMLVAWELAALRPHGPYPILVFMAEQGAAKTTTTRALRRLIDPNDSDVRRPPRNTEDLMIAASNGHIVAFDNLSRLSEDLSDNLSVLATGGGFAVRRLYTNTEEHIFNAQRPVILNGISQVATRGDLLDRAIVLTLPPIPEERRRDEATFWKAFTAAQPQLLGALLDATVVGLHRVGDVHLKCKPRMADFAIWSTAVEPACPWPEGTFLRVYAGNRQGAIEATLDGDPVADVVQMILPWEGIATEFLKKLNELTSESITKRKEWFSQPRQVADALRRLAPGLRRMGIEVSFLRAPHTGRRVIRIEKTGHDSSPPSPKPDYQADSGDETGDAGRAASPLSSPEDLNKSGRGDAGDGAKPLFQHTPRAIDSPDDAALEFAEERPAIQAEATKPGAAAEVATDEVFNL